MELVDELRSFARNLREAERCYAQPPSYRVIADRLDAGAANIERLTRERDMWHARAISLFWNPGDEATCAAVRNDADRAMEWIKRPADSAKDSGNG